jgi:hypothetical protein
MRRCNNLYVSATAAHGPRRPPAYDRSVRHNPSTVVVLAGQPGDGLLTAVSRPVNVTLVRPEAPAGPGGADGSAGDGIEAAASALRRAARISSPYVLVAADPLAALAAQWQAMWELTQAPRGSEAFELRAGEALAAWRANQFELPDYYLVLAREQPPGGPQPGGREQPPDFYLGPLRALRPHRVAVVAASEPAEQAAGILTALGSLRHGRWWPPLPDVVDAARRFYPGSLSVTPDGSAVPLLRLPVPLQFPGFSPAVLAGASNVRPPRHDGCAAPAEPRPGQSRGHWPGHRLQGQCLRVTSQGHSPRGTVPGSLS